MSTPDGVARVSRNAPWNDPAAGLTAYGAYETWNAVSRSTHVIRAQIIFFVRAHPSRRGVNEPQTLVLGMNSLGERRERRVRTSCGARCMIRLAVRWCEWAQRHHERHISCAARDVPGGHHTLHTRRAPSPSVLANCKALDRGARGARG